MRIVNGRKIPEASDFASMGDQAKVFDNIADLMEECAELLGSVVDGDDLAADAGILAGALTVGGLLTGSAGLGITGNAEISGSVSSAGMVSSNGISVNAGTISISSSTFYTGISVNSVSALSITGGTYGFQDEAERTTVINKLEAIDTVLKNLGLYSEAE